MRPDGKVRFGEYVPRLVDGTRAVTMQFTAFYDTDAEFRENSLHRVDRSIPPHFALGDSRRESPLVHGAALGGLDNRRLSASRGWGRA